MSSDESAVHPSLRLLLDLFATQLKDVKFPDIDLAVLKEAERRVEVLAEDLRRMEAAAEAGRAALAEGQEALLGKGQRALAYLKVFAEENPLLAGRLEPIVLPRTQRRARLEPTAAATGPLAASTGGGDLAPRPRGRPRKVRSEAQLFSDGPMPMPMAADAPAGG